MMKIKMDQVPKVLIMMRMMTIMKMKMKLTLNAAFLIKQGKTSMSPNLFCVVNTNLDTWFQTLALRVLQA